MGSLEAYWGDWSGEVTLVVKGVLILGALVYFGFAGFVWRQTSRVTEVLQTQSILWFRRLALAHLIGSLGLIFIILGLL